MKWVTWENVGVDRIGSAWLIRRSIDPKAQFLFVPHGQQPLPKGAEPFDIPGVRHSHHAGHCTFHTLVEEFKLDDLVLRRIARIIDEADTVQEVGLEPVASGLDLICRGIRLTCTTDEEALQRGAQVYNAIYAQLAADAAEGAGGSP